MSASRLRLSWSGHLADGFHTAKSGQDATIPFCRHRQQTVNTARELGVIVDSQLTSDHVIRLQGLCVNRRTIGPLRHAPGLQPVTRALLSELAAKIVSRLCIYPFAPGLL